MCHHYSALLSLPGSGVGWWLSNLSQALQPISCQVPSDPVDGQCLLCTLYTGGYSGLEASTTNILACQGEELRVQYLIDFQIQIYLVLRILVRCEKQQVLRSSVESTELGLGT